MKNILSFLSVETFKENIKTIISRFPISIIIILITTGLFLLLSHGDFIKEVENNLVKSIFSLIITFFLSLGIYITTENSNSTGFKNNIYQLFPILFGILFFINFNSNIENFENFVLFLLTIAGIISFLFFAPYLKNIINNNVKQSVYYTYFYKISVVFLTSFILGIILFLLGNIAIATVFELFDISWLNNSKIISDWAIISLSLVTPIFALTQIPNKKTYNENHFNENIFFSFLIKYIAIPFIYVYFIILYAYTLKVLSNFGDWPKGEVSWMVIGFSIFGYITYIFSYIFEEKNKFIKTFRKAFPYVVIPQLFMLVYAIYLRVAQYDLTVNRYFVIVFGLWLLIISLYYIISNKKSLSFITAILTLFTIIISVGPWSVYNLPETRQYNRLITNLKTAGICINENVKGNECINIVPLKEYSDINKELSKDIHSGINYLCDFDECSKIKELFPEQYKKLEEKTKKEFDKNIEEEKAKAKDNQELLEEINNRIYNGPNIWQIKSFITDEIKVQEYVSMNDETQKSSINIYLKDNISLFPIEIKGYNKLYEMNSYTENENQEYAKIDIELKNITIVQNGNIINTIDITEIINQLYNKYDITKNEKFSLEDLTFEKGNYKIILNNIEIENPKYTGIDDYKYFYSNGYLLTK